MVALFGKVVVSSEGGASLKEFSLWSLGLRAFLESAPLFGSFSASCVQAQRNILNENGMPWFIIFLLCLCCIGQAPVVRGEIERQNLKQEHREVCYLYVATYFLIFEVQQSLTKHL